MAKGNTNNTSQIWDIPFGMHKCYEDYACKTVWSMESILPPKTLVEPKPTAKVAYIRRWLSMWFFFSVVANMGDKGCWNIRLSFTYNHAHTLQHFNVLTLQVSSVENIDIMQVLVIPRSKVLPSKKLLKVTFVLIPSQLHTQEISVGNIFHTSEKVRRFYYIYYLPE